MILRSVEEGISFKIEVFPMTQLEPEDFPSTWSPNTWAENLAEHMEEIGATSFVCGQITAILEPVVAGPGQCTSSTSLDTDPETWEGSPLHHEVQASVGVGQRILLFVCPEGLRLAGDYGARVIEEKEEA